MAALVAFLDRLLGRRRVSQAEAEQVFSRRTMLLGGAQLGVGALIVGRTAWLSVAQNERYTLLAESNRVNLSLIPPRRGWIVDRAGHPLALNRTVFRVDIIPDRMGDDGPRILDTLQAQLGLTADERDRIERDVDKAAGFQPVQVAENIDWEHFAALSIRAPELPGVVPSQGFARHYPSGAAVAHVLGYVGAASAEQYRESKDPLLVTPGFKVGKDNIEKAFEPMLRGKAGARRSEVTARGKLVRELATRPDTPGQTLQLTLDAGLQEFAARRMGLESGSCIVIDCQTGAILALVSMPAFDPNSFSDGIGRKEWASLQADDHLPLLNKATRGLYPPGSTVKPVAAVALIEHGIDPEERVFCPGGYRLGNRTFKCLGRHGSLSMPHAIEKSCNTYFYAMAHRVGYDAIAPVARAMGMGQEFDIAGINQRFGTVPDSAWKQRRLKQPWTTADSLNATIGQGFVSVSPLQLAVVAARLASGRDLTPTLFAHQLRANPAPLRFSAEALGIARQGMDLVVNGNGTGARSRLPLPDVRLAGKTGTAQVRRLGPGRGGVGVPWKYRDHGLFICFAPVDNPRYACSVVIEHGMGGARAAAPVAKDVLTFLYDREKAMAALTAFEAGWGGDLATRMARKQALIANPVPPVVVPPQVQP